MKLFNYILVISLFMFGHGAPKDMDDLSFIYQEILENHPGVYNKEDPSFKSRLDFLYSQARESMHADMNPDEVKQVLNTFVDSFDDIHLYINWYGMKGGCGGSTMKQLSISRLAQKAVWIRVPTFSFDENQQFDDLSKELKQLPPQEFVVFDIRGNGGGSSQNGQRLMTAFFGQDYVAQKLCIEASSKPIDWRVSKGNIKHILPFLDQVGLISSLTPEEVIAIKSLRSGLADSLASGDPIYREQPSRVCDTKSYLNKGKDITYVVVTDEANGSSALIFIDELKLMTENLILVGHKTGKDTKYNELRYSELPSGLGKLGFPIKVHNYRMRPSNTPYLPDVPYENINDTEDLKAFIIREWSLGG